ncbi:MAG: type IV pilus twitching motility protein PilT [Candidatus Spechtbacteria bacterium]|nr:type IV pilus twitching motility protein PilT [Candidatus Spechtbacteria bacterium]
MPKSIVNYDATVKELLQIAARQEASDLHISVGRPPTLRIDGKLVPILDQPTLMPTDTEGLVMAVMKEIQKDILHKNGEVDFSFMLQDSTRFRVNIYKQSGFLSGAFRLIPAKIRTLEELQLPPILHQFTKYTQGFFLVVGASGQGKSTTLAALIDEINHTRTEHVITIEDPIEYQFVQHRCIIDQREVHQDTLSFASALRASLREDPDVIMVGEMRDPETISTAITAAETGHLVFATLHTNNAAQTIDRIIDTFPPGQQSQVRSQLALTILGVLSERLIPRIEGGRLPAVELMIANHAIRNLIREEKTFELNLVIETNVDEGMISLNRSLAELVKRGEISLEDAESYSLNVDELRMLIG